MKKVLAVVKSIGTKAALAGAGVMTMAGTAKAAFDAADITPIPILSDVTLPDLVTSIINIVLVVAGILAVVYLIWGGISYVTAGGDAEKASKGRVAITNAIIGILIIIAALAIYNYVITLGQG